MGDPRPVSPSFKHIPALDGLRGVAILLVLGFHLLWSNFAIASPLLSLIVHLRAAGWVGVDLFFALSGYLITGILWDTRSNPHFFRNFYARRFLRIAPLYYVALLILLIGFHPHTGAAARPFLLLFAYLQNTALWWNGNISGLVSNFTAHLWSLAAEEQFYLLWPVIVLVAPNRRALLWIAAVLAACSPVARYLLLAHGASFQATYKLTFCRADSLLAGAWLALALRGLLRDRLFRVAPFLFSAAALACLAIAWTTGNFNFANNRSVNLFGYSLLALAGASLVAMALRPASVTARLLGSPLLRFFGRYSYGLYVLHQIVAAAVEYRFGDALRSSIHSKSLLHITFMLVVLAVTVPLATLSYHLLERPFLRLKRFFDAHPSRPAASSRSLAVNALSPDAQSRP